VDVPGRSPEIRGTAMDRVWTVKRPHGPSNFDPRVGRTRGSSTSILDGRRIPWTNRIAAGAIGGVEISPRAILTTRPRVTWRDLRTRGVVRTETYHTCSGKESLETHGGVHAHTILEATNWVQNGWCMRRHSMFHDSSTDQRTPTVAPMFPKSIGMDAMPGPQVLRDRAVSGM